jgi:hypothetical protein
MKQSRGSSRGAQETFPFWSFMKVTILVVSVIFLVSLSVHAKDPAVGGMYGTGKGFVLGDFNGYNQDQEYMEVGRYGGGQGRFQAGDNFGITAGANGGAFVGKNTEVLKPRLGVEFGGRLSFNTSNKIESFYEWTPGLAAGLQMRAFGLSVLPTFKYGVAIGNLGKTAWTPRSHFNVYGPGLYVSAGECAASYSRTVIADNILIEDLDVSVYNMGYRYEKSLGLRDQHQHILMYRFDLR